MQVSCPCPVHWPWCPPWRWCWRGILHHRSCHDCLLPQVWWRFLPWYWWPQGKTKRSYRNLGLYLSLFSLWARSFRTVQDAGAGKGKNYSINFPLGDGTYTISSLCLFPSDPNSPFALILCSCVCRCRRQELFVCLPARHDQGHGNLSARCRRTPVRCWFDHWWPSGLLQSDAERWVWHAVVVSESLIQRLCNRLMFCVGWSFLQATVNVCASSSRLVCQHLYSVCLFPILKRMRLVRF